MFEFPSWSGFFLSYGLAALLGMGLAGVVERLMQPLPPLRRPWASWGIMLGLWLVLHAVLSVLLMRPWFAMALTNAFWLMLVLVNNAKYKVLREPFLFQDYQYFIDAIRYPRLYIPFLGWYRFFGAAAGFLLAVVLGFWLEPTLGWPWPAPESGSGAAFFFGAVRAPAVELIIGGVWIAASRHRLPALSFDPVPDLMRHGFASFLWAYAQGGRVPSGVSSPFEEAKKVKTANQGPGQAQAAQGQRGRYRSGSGPELPHLVAVQSESFFDARDLYSGVRHNVLAQFDKIRQESFCYGQLQVPAWGANTVRTEFAFLSGLMPETLGVHQFNPYRAVLAGWRLLSLARWLKDQGYRTICVHPYPAGFYGRNKVFERMGFDQFFDIRYFDKNAYAGQYVGDEAVGEFVTELIDTARQPTFIMAITMENHGPLHLETLDAGDLDVLYKYPPPDGCSDLGVYLRHLRRADQMAGQLRHYLDSLSQPASLCWYGDHVPIMPAVYETLGTPMGHVPFVCWGNTTLRQHRRPNNTVMDTLPAEQLSLRWLREAGFEWLE